MHEYHKKPAISPKMHNKTEKFTTQLRHATHGERRNTANIKISANQSAQIRQVPVTMLQQMFKVTCTRFHTAMQSFCATDRQRRR